MHRSKLLLRLALLFAVIAGCAQVIAQTGPGLTWITNSSVKLEQVIGDYDYEAYAQGIYLPTASQTV